MQVPSSKSLLEVAYLHLPPGAELPALALGSFRVLIVVESEVTAAWQNAVSDWLVRAGCLYMMAWGLDCSSWDDSVDWANIEQFAYEEIPWESFVLTSWHENDSLEEVMHLCKHFAVHPSVELSTTLLLQISAEAQDVKLARLYDSV